LKYKEEEPEKCILLEAGTDIPCGTRLTKLFRYAPNIRFVGSGFFINDKEK
jgi:predicted nucleic acid-binding Zn ribbon protein